MVNSLAPLPARMTLPERLTPEQAKDPARVARWMEEVLVALETDNSAFRSWAGNIEPVVTTTEEAVTVVQNEITVINNSLVTGSELGEPVWEWNGVDATQFETSAAWTSGTVSPSITVTAAANVNQTSQNELRLSSTGTGSGGFGYFITDEIPFVGERRDMVIEWVTGPSSTTGYGGFSLMADNAGTTHCYNTFIGPTAGWRSQVDAGTVTIPGSTPARVWDGAGQCRGRCWVRGVKPSGDLPRFHFSLESLPGNGGEASYSVRRDERDNYPNEPPGSSWDNLECRKFGVAVQASGGNAYGDFRLTELRVYLV